MTSKKEQLIQLDKLLLGKMINIMEGKGDMADLRDLATPMNYLRNNAVVAKKTKSTLERDNKKRLAEADKRRSETGN